MRGPGAHPPRAAGPVEVVRYGGREVKQDHVVHLGRGRRERGGEEGEEDICFWYTATLVAYKVCVDAP